MQDWLSHRVQATPDRTALVRASTGESLDFASLDAMVDDLAGRLKALGVETGDHLGMVMETRLAAVCTVHAAERLGAVLVPLGDGLTPVELANQTDAADVTTLVCSEETEATAVEAFEGPVCSVDEPTHRDVASLAAVSPAPVTPAEWDLDDTRLLLFTSGTTGDPKVVRLTVGNLLSSAIASVFRLGLHGDDRWLVCLSLHHMGGLSPVLRMPLYGMTVVLQDSFDPGRTADDIGSYDVTCVSLVPTMLKRMLDLRGTLADSLRVVLLGGAPAPDALLERCRDFSVPVHPTYGMTETASQVATATPREAFKNIGTVGRPLFWTSVTVRDDDGTVCEAGNPGELVVDGPTVSPGYYRNPDATHAAFGTHGLRTGDVGYRDDKGRLFVLGRVDDQIITGGENVHPQEVQTVLRSHPMVDDVAVVGVPDDEWGELVGALVVPSDDELTLDELEQYCRERLAGFKLPRAISFVDELPLTDSGTVERTAARDRLVAGMNKTDGERESDVTTDVDFGGDETDDASEPTGTNDEQTAATGVEDIGEWDRRDVPHSDEQAETAALDDDADDVGVEGLDESEPDSETFLIGGSDWKPGDPVPTDDESDDSDDDLTAPDSDQRADEPETPDFVREVLSDDSDVVDPDDTTASGDDDGRENEGKEGSERADESESGTEGESESGTEGESESGTEGESESGTEGENERTDERRSD